jgi:hypothetical protein
MLCRSLFGLLSFFLWPLCCLFFFVADTHMTMADTHITMADTHMTMADTNMTMADFFPRFAQAFQ